MPAFVTHALFGEETRAGMSERARAAAECSRAAYEWGLQGPDLLFFNGALSPLADRTLNHLGGEMHRFKTRELFQAMCGYIRTRKDQDVADWLRAYFMGFCCHYALDVATHPYIFWRQHCLELVYPDRRGVHNRVESDLDTDYYYLRTGKRIWEYRLEPALRRDLDVRREIAKLYQTVLWTVYHRLAELDALVACFDSAIRVIPALMGHGAPLLVARAADGLSLGRVGLNAHMRRATVRGDVLNLRRMRWKVQVPGAYPSDQTFPELTVAARKLASRMQEQVLDCLQAEDTCWSDRMPAFDYGRPRKCPVPPTANENA